MSHWDTGTTAGNLPPEVATSYETQSGTAVPASHILLVKAFDSTENNINGIVTKGGVSAGDPPGTGAANELAVYLTNRIAGTGTTTDAVTPVQVYSFAMGATPGTYLFTTNISVFNVTDSLSASYSEKFAVRTDGVIGTLITTGLNFMSEEGAMSALSIANSIVGNNLELDVTGLAGKTIHFVAVVEYILAT